jgi:hypothetical protein
LKSKRHLEKATKNQNIQYFECRNCNKKYNSRSGLCKHNKNCKNPPPSPPEIPPENILLLERIINLENQINNNQNKKVIQVETQYIYLVQEREFTKTGEPIYKIGKTKQENLTRFKQYSKGSRMLCQIISKDCDEDERILLSKFRESYIPRKDVGSEYFEGDYEKMIQDIYETICKK